jgi:hypothetical protein
MSGLSATRGLVTCCLLLLQTAPAQAASTEPALPIDEAREISLLETAGAGFKVKRTPHFVIAYNTTTDLVDGLVNRLEFTYASIYRFCGRAGISVDIPDHRLEVIFFEQRDQYDRYSATIRFRSEGTNGVYHEPSNRAAFFNIANDPQMLQMQASVLAARKNLDELTQALDNIRGSRTVVELEFIDGRKEWMTRQEAEKQVEHNRKELRELDGRRNRYTSHINQTVVQHETAHQVLHNAGVHTRGAANPAWLIEGLACLFETPPGRAGAGLGAINQLRLQDFRDAVAGNNTSRKLTARDYLDAVAAERIASPRRIVLEPKLLRQPGPDRTTAYAVAWALTTYLQRACGTQFAAYLREIAARRPGQAVTPQEELALFEKHFGPPDETFEQRFASYILNLAVIGIRPR